MNPTSLLLSFSCHQHNGHSLCPHSYDSADSSHHRISCTNSPVGIYKSHLEELLLVVALQRQQTYPQWRPANKINQEHSQHYCLPSENNALNAKVLRDQNMLMEVAGGQGEHQVSRLDNKLLRCEDTGKKWGKKTRWQRRWVQERCCSAMKKFRMSMRTRARGGPD